MASELPSLLLITEFNFTELIRYWYFNYLLI
jgi:hypothetical protein